MAMIMIMIIMIIIMKSCEDISSKRDYIAHIHTIGRNTLPMLSDEQTTPSRRSTSEVIWSMTSRSISWEIRRAICRPSNTAPLA